MSQLTKARDAQRDREGAEIEAKKQNVHTLRQEAEDNYEECKRLIADDDSWRA